MEDRIPEESRQRDPAEEGGNQLLFRPQVLAARQSQWLGTVLVAPTISSRLFTVFATLSMCAIVSMLLLFDYTRKERISGWLVPERGLVQVIAPQAGVITEVHVRDGAVVRIGAPLFTLSTEIESATLGATQEEIVRRLQSRLQSIVAEGEVQRRLLAEELDGLGKRIAALESQERHLEGELEIQTLKTQLAQTTASRLARLLDQGLIAAPNYEVAEDNRLNETLKARDLARQQSAAQQERIVVEAEARALPLRTDALLADLDRQAATLEQELAVTEAQRRIVITATQPGTVTGLRADLGSSVSTSVPLLSIVPAGSKLQAELFVPSSAIGFIRAGQTVQLRYRAFPYQRFGHYVGAIRNVSLSTVSPNELGSRLTGLTTLLSGTEAVYLVTVELARQDVTAYGDAVPLQPGMLIEADVSIETRRLIDWVFDPLYTLTGRLRA